jgi:uncharacterized protein (TIGR03437 family)
LLITPGAFQSAPGGDFLMHLSASGSLIFSTYLPFASAYSASYPAAMDLDSAGNLVVAGTVTTGGLATGAGAFQSALAGSGNAYAMKFTPAGVLIGASYLGGSGTDTANLIAAAPNGSVVIAGFTQSSDFPGNTQPTPVAYPGASFVTSLFPALTAQNAASFAANTVAPGEIVALRGYGIGPATGTTQPSGVQVFFDNFAAPVTYAQAGQINVQAPWEIAGQTSTQVTVMYNGAPAGSAVVPVGAALPGIFYINNSDGLRNSPSNPARAGDYVTVYGTGGGVMNPPGVTGSAWPLLPLSQFTQPVSVTVGGETAGVLYAGSAPLMASGVFQINVRLPADLTAAAQFLCVKAGGAMSAAAISIQ